MLDGHSGLDSLFVYYVGVELNPTGSTPDANDANNTMVSHWASLNPDGDHDSDGVSNGEEEDLGTDPYDSDTDGDGLHDGDEIAEGTNPNKIDSDEDGLSDGEEFDYGTDPTWSDTDGDGLHDGDEIDIGTDPNDSDTDGDGVNDGTELDLGRDPLAFDAKFIGCNVYFKELWLLVFFGTLPVLTRRRIG